MDVREFAVTGPFAMAVEQTEDAVRLQTNATAPRKRLNLAITLIDSMLWMLEDVNVTGTVPAKGSVESTMWALRQVIPIECEIEVGAARSNEKLMDELFNVQQQLLVMRAGPAWMWAHTDDEHETADRVALHSGV
ncbi:MAG: hypothetical protein ABI334_07575 [Candidatus Dormiibacterota bacterium]